MSNLAEQFQDLSLRLKQLQEQLLAAARSSSDAEPPPAHVIDEFKTAVDQTRQVLWCYIEVTSKNAGLGLDHALASYREQRVTEMLHLIRPEGTKGDPGSFFEDVNNMVGEYLDRPSIKRAG